MAKVSAGILLYRRSGGQLEIFLVHPGGPFWARKDEGSWSVPKGEVETGEDLLQSARREFQEETGQPVDGYFIELLPLKQPGGKVIHAWAVEGDIDPQKVKSNIFSMEWPPNSGTLQQFPEIDRAGWFTPDPAFKKILPGQRNFLEQVLEKLKMNDQDEG